MRWGIRGHRGPALGFAVQGGREVVAEEVVVDRSVLGGNDLIVIEVDLVEDGLVEVAA
ncbi:MAG: hypothetical protein Q4D89_06020 [Arachnia propionica]|uniref:hypothetical protein n=1 Tax=Arachnia propionica TaxID=1750 RepID=UPI00270CB7E6|nr:hypothetical protein [Arachnia propionica]